MTIETHRSPPATVSSETILNAHRWRYATKLFDPQMKLTAEQWSTLEQSLVLTPSAYGLQPWRFLVATNEQLKQELRPVSWDQPQVADCSHLVVFAARQKIEESDVQHYLETIAKVRKMPISALENYKKIIVSDIMESQKAGRAFEWAARQCYIALGNLMTTAAIIGIDTCPMEGIDTEAYDRILNMPAIGYHTVVACAVGFRSTEDKYVHLKKVRYSADEVVIRR